MVFRDGHPARYQIDRKGTPDPANSIYWVLDVVNDYAARVALARLGRLYETQGYTERAAEVWAVLDESKQAHARVMEARSPPGKSR